MSTVYRCLPRQQREADQAAYLEFLRERDGVPSLKTRSLSRRERYFRDIDAHPVRYRGPVPQEEFRALYDRGQVAKQPTQKALWMSLVAQLNEGEQYGISLQLDSYGGKGADGHTPLIYSELEEVYHTRVFVDVMKTLGVELYVRKPRGILRPFVWAAASLPKFISAPLVFLFEIIGVVVFTRLRAMAPRLFADDPAAAQRILSLLDEVLVDEIGHVSYARSRLGPVRLFCARWFVRLMAPIVVRQNPAVPRLFDVNALASEASRFDWDMIPSDLRGRAFLPSDAGPDGPSADPPAAVLHVSP
jgi:hypothetical protein